MSNSGKFISIFPSLHRFACSVTVIFIFLITYNGYGQTVNDTIPKPGAVRPADSISLKSPKATDSAATTADSSKAAQMEKELGIRISREALPSVVTATARDSAVMDMKRNVFYLYGQAQVNYEDLQLNAGEVSFVQNENIVTAAPYRYERDTAKVRPSFKQGSEKFSYDSMQYNFRSKRAIVRNVSTQYGEGYIHSEQIKRNPDQTIYGWHSVYTTCALDTPHFGIRARKQKIIPGKVVVSGSANLEIEGVPTPLYLPFGIFPSSTKQKSGFILPTYTMEQQRGFGLLNGGYYFYINDKVDAFAQTNVYAKGSYAVAGTSTYNNMYHYRGTMRVSYAYNKTGEDFEPNASVTKDFMINWQHNSDAKSVPGQTFNASVQAGTSSFYANNSYDANQVLQNQYQSNISYAKNWQNRPFGLTVSALHNQNTANKQINVTLPSMNFYVNQFNPFQRKNAVGNHWYDKVTASYSADLQNRTTFYDSTFSLSNLSLSSFQNGIRQSIPVSASYTALRYINVSFSANYNEYWQTNRIIQSYNDALGKIDSVNTNGFYAARDFNTGVSLSTRIYGMKVFRKGKLRGIRHVLTPSTGFTYRPDFAKAPFNYYYNARLDTSSRTQLLSPWPASVIGIPPSGKLAAMNFGLNNNLQIKVRSAKDTASGYKNVTLIDGFSINTAYNAAADSFRWSDIAVSFRTNVLEKINISGGASYSPYAIDYGTGRVLQQTMLERGTGVGRFRSAAVSMSTSFRSKTKNGPANTDAYRQVMRNAGYNEYVDFNIPWNFTIGYTLNADSRYIPAKWADSIVVSHAVNLSGELQLTELWKLAVITGYNFDLKQMTITSFNLYRDMHCWQMQFMTFPFGPRKHFNFTLNVKSTVLQDLKLVRRRDFRDLPN
jgi:lipopolysaccharide assembly outer membrane protein LptD (OstA)